MELTPYLEEMQGLGASDLFVTVGFPVSAKVNGQMTPIGASNLTEEDALALVHDAMSDKQQDGLAKTKECTFASDRD